MAIIRKKKQKDIAIHLGYMWFFVKRLNTVDFVKCADLFMLICHEIGVPWEAIEESSAFYETVWAAMEQED